MAAPHMAPPGWYADPAGRHEHRYWDGVSWTEAVADAGVTAADPLRPAPRTVLPLGLADPSRVPAPATVPFAAAPAPPAAARRRKPRWTIPITVLGTALALALLAGLVIRAPWASTPLLRPTGLTVGPFTEGSVAFHWSRPATGPPPDKYLILGNGKLIGSVPGTATSYRQSGLAPGTAYRYRVAALRGGTRSAPSAALVVTTAIPPTPAARLQGSWTVSIKIVRGAAALAGQGSTQWTESWLARPRCAAGPCSIRLLAAINGHPFKATLTRAGGLYKGTAEAHVFPCESGVTSLLVRSTLRIRITVTAGHVENRAWQASAWTGTVVISAPYTVSGGFVCGASRMTAAVSVNS